MKSFQIPMLPTRGIAMSLLGLCLLSGLHAPPAYADFTFGEPVNLGPGVNGPIHDTAAWVMPDELSLYFWRGAAWADVGEAWLATRSTAQDPWASSVCLGPWDETTVIESVQIWPGFTTADGLEVYFSDWRADLPRPGGYGGLDLWMMKRQTLDAPWGNPINLGAPVNSAQHDWCSTVSPDGLMIYFCSTRPEGQGGSDLWVTSRAARNEHWGTPVNLGATVNSTVWDSRPRLSADGLALFFDSERGGGFGANDLYVTTRPSLSSPWGAPFNLGSTINSPAGEACVFISADGSTLYFGSERPDGYGGADIWQLSVKPVVDFNHDGKVDEEDETLLKDRWGTDDPEYDIGPMPWGDGVVNDADLTVLISAWGQPVGDPTLAAHWALDEAEGFRARDSISGQDAVVVGDVVWQPAAGQVAGALQLDGTGDCVITSFLLDPSRGPFSVFAWIKGGGPGQVAVAQAIGANCLMTDAEGKLMTELQGPGRLSGPLQSQKVVTDGKWHRIGLEWDGVRRILYVDNAVVAEDLQDDLEGPGVGLYIGAGKGMEQGSFWSGLIDDVRVINPVKPYEFAIQCDTTGFEIYADHNTPDVYSANWADDGIVDFLWQTDSLEGSCCLYCTGIERYGDIHFGFWPRDMTRLVQEGYSLEFWVRGDSPGSRFDVRFLDTKTTDPEDHPWRMRWIVSESVAKWDDQWHLVRLPLKSFTEHGSWDNDMWYSQQGKFDWSAVQCFEIVAEHHDWVGRTFLFDSIRVCK